MATCTVTDRIGAIEWHALKPGDRVLIPWRPEPYRERLVIPCRGTEAARIVVEGVPGPAGELPVIDAADAATDPQFAVGYQPLEALGLVAVWRTAKAGDVRPGFLDLIGLRVQGANAVKPGNGFTGADGRRSAWDAHASGVYLAGCDSVRVIGCEVTDNANGVFTSDSQPCADITLERCRFWGNGKPGSDLCHQTYCQAAGMVYRNNWYGDIRPGSGGGALKDRSAAVVIEGNTVTAAARCLDLSGWQGETASREKTPDAARTVIRGNVLLNRSSLTLVYIEGRGPGERVEFVNNTAVQRIDQGRLYYSRVFFSEYADAAEVVAAGNLFDFGPATPGAAMSEPRLFDSLGRLTLGANWAAPWVSDYGERPGAVTGRENLTTSATPAAFLDAAAGDFRVVPGTAADGFGAGSAPRPVPVPDPAPVVPPVVPPPPPVPPVVPPVVPPPPPPPPAANPLAALATLTPDQLAALRVARDLFARGA